MAIAGSLWIDGNALMWHDGSVITGRVGVFQPLTPDTSRSGSLWVESDKLYYYGSDGVERYFLGTDLGLVSGAVPGSIWMEGGDIHWIGETANHEFYITDALPEDLFPDFDVSENNFTNDDGTSTLWSYIDEDPPDDATSYIQSAHATGGALIGTYFHSELEEPVEQHDQDQFHQIRVRCRRREGSGIESGEVTIRRMDLYENGTLIASDAIGSVVDTSWTTYVSSNLDAEGITNYDDVEIRIQFDIESLSSGGSIFSDTWVEVTQAYLDIN